MKIKMLLLLSMVAITAFNCSKSEKLVNSNKIPFTVIGQGNLYATEGLPRQYMVIKTNSDWENLIAKMDLPNNTSSTFTETHIDFSKFIIIAAIDEIKHNGGWTIDITGITENSQNITVSVENLAKGNATAVITQPFEIVKIPVSNKEITFKNK